MTVNTAYDMLLEEIASRDQAMLRTVCGICGWSYEGAAGDGRMMFRSHLDAEHPGVRGRKGARRGRQPGDPTPVGAFPRGDAERLAARHAAARKGGAATRAVAP